MSKTFLDILVTVMQHATLKLGNPSLIMGLMSSFAQFVHFCYEHKITFVATNDRYYFYFSCSHILFQYCDEHTRFNMQSNNIIFRDYMFSLRLCSFFILKMSSLPHLSNYTTLKFTYIPKYSHPCKNIL